MRRINFLRFPPRVGTGILKVIHWAVLWYERVCSRENVCENVAQTWNRSKYFHFLLQVWCLFFFFSATEPSLSVLECMCFRMIWIWMISFHRSESLVNTKNAYFGWCAFRHAFLADSALLINSLWLRCLGIGAKFLLWWNHFRRNGNKWESLIWFAFQDF